MTTMLLALLLIAWAETVVRRLATVPTPTAERGLCHQCRLRDAA